MIEEVLAKIEHWIRELYIYQQIVCELIQLVFAVIELLRALIELVGTLNIWVSVNLAFHMLRYATFHTLRVYITVS